MSLFLPSLGDAKHSWELPKLMSLLVGMSLPALRGTDLFPYSASSMNVLAVRTAWLALLRAMGEGHQLWPLSHSWNHLQWWTIVVADVSVDLR